MVRKAIRKLAVQTSRQPKDQKMKKMKILQLNVNRSKASQSLLGVMANEAEADILAVSEPNRNMVKGGSWKCDLEEDCAIQLLNTKRAILQSGTGPGFVWLELTEYRIFSCYYSPNKPMEDINLALDELANVIRSSKKGAIIVGDFNAKSPEWGECREDARGRALSDWAAALQLVCLNEGSEPTFVRGESTSRLDITFCTEGVARKFKSWKILESDVLSDHRCIEANFDSRQQVHFGHINGWKVDKPGYDRLKDAIQINLEMLQTVDPMSLTKAVTRACGESLCRKGFYGSRKKPVYWWTAEIGELRRECLRARRQIVRMNRQTRGMAPEWLKTAFANKRREFRKAILNSMKQRWKEVCDSVEEDVWGNGYRIVMKKLGQPLPVLTCEMMKQVVRALFPKHPAINYEEIAATNIPPFTELELEKAWKRIKTKKSSGPDGIPPEAVILAAKSQPRKVLQAMNYALLNEQFPAAWKRANLVLLKKPGKPDNSPSSYRPLCLLDTLGKLLEHLLLGRLKSEIERTGGLSENQFGFREGHSTVGAIQKVIGLVDRAAAGTRRTRKIPVVITLDIRNAFNSASWQIILDLMKKRGIDDYLRRLIQQYFKERKILMKTEQGCLEVEVSSGVPQGSILGPTLWNLLYDGVLRLPLPDGASLVGYADDLALVVASSTEQLLTNKANRALSQISDWMQSHGLQVAPEKTEAIVMAGRRVLSDIRFRVNGVEIATSKKLKYLGVWLDHKRSFQVHVQETSRKCASVVGSLSRLMRNIRGPRSSTRRLLATVVSSVALYAVPVWFRALNITWVELALDRVQRKMAIRVCSGYRTLSAEAAFVLASLPPLGLLAQERVDRQAGMEERQARDRLLERWQERWVNRPTGAWTRTLIPNLAAWVNRKHGETDFHLTQFLAGHGDFQKYLFQMGKTDSVSCKYCGDDDTPEHTILKCERWDQLRRPYLLEVGILTSENVINKMLEGENQWGLVAEMVKKILMQKGCD